MVFLAWATLFLALAFVVFLDVAVFSAFLGCFFTASFLEDLAVFFFTAAGFFRWLALGFGAALAFVAVFFFFLADSSVFAVAFFAIKTCLPHA